MRLPVDWTRPIVCLGDSITASGWPEALEPILHRRGQEAARCVNAGIRGNTSTQGLRRLDRDVVRHHPGLVFVEFGFNDCNIILNAPAPRVAPDMFRHNLLTMVEAIRTVGALVVLIANHRTLVKRPLSDGRTYEEHSQEYSAITAAVAAESGVPLLDLRETFPGPELSLEQALLDDGIHLSPPGVQAYAASAAELL